MKQIKIVLPAQRQTILGDKITISFIVSDFNVGADGYLNLWLDDPREEVSTAAKITGQFDYTLSSLPPGKHKITLEAVKSNNLSFRPPVKQTVYFTTSLPQIPSVTPLAPVKSVFNFINWQYFMVIFGVIIVSIGLIIKATFGKPKMWE